MKGLQASGMFNFCIGSTHSILTKQLDLKNILFYSSGYTRGYPKIHGLSLLLKIYLKY
jgi:hypothetical protein